MYADSENSILPGKREVNKSQMPMLRCRKHILEKWLL